MGILNLLRGSGWTGERNNVTKKNLGNDSNWNRAESPTKDTTSPLMAAYETNVWVYAAVNAIAVNTSQAPINLRTKSRGEVLDDMTTNDWGRLLKNPNPLIDLTQLMSVTTINYEVSGQAFWLLRGGDGRPISSQKEVPREIWPVNPTLVQPRYRIPNKPDSGLVGWNLLSADKTTKEPLEFYQLIRFYRASPNNIMKAMSPLVPAWTSIATDGAAHTYNKKFFENGASPEGALRYEGEEMERHELEAVRGDWDSRQTGVENAHKTPVLSNGFSYEKLSTSHKDMDFSEQLKMSREEIIAVLNVPKHQVSLYEDTNYSTAQVADRAFWNNNIIPRLKYFESVMNNKMMLLADVEVFFDLKDIEALKLDTEMVINNAKALQGMGYPLNEVNERMDLNMEDVKEDWANTAVDMRDVPESPEEREAKAQADADAKAQAPKAQPPKPVQKPKPKSTGESVEDMVTKGIVEETFKAKSQADLYKLIREGETKAIDPYIEKYEGQVFNPVRKPWEKAFNGYYLKQKKEVLTAFDKLARKSSIAPITKEDIEAGDLGKILPDPRKWDKTLKQMALPFQAETFANSDNFLEEEIGGFVEFRRGSAENAKELKAINKKIVGINKRGRKSLRATLAEGVTAGESNAELRKRISHHFEGRFNKVATIVRTETGMAAQATRNVAMKIEGLKKQWLTAGDNHVRGSHKDYGVMQPKKLDYEYSPGLKYPLDTSAEAEEIINCRCLHIAVKA